MAGNYAQLLDIINNPTQHGLPAWDNNAKQIEGETVQQYLLAIINSLTVGYQFMGVATPSTSPGTPDQNVFYIGGAGTYNGFGSNPITIDVGYIGIIRWNGAWSSEPIKIADVVSVSNGVLFINGEQTSVKTLSSVIAYCYTPSAEASKTVQIENFRIEQGSQNQPLFMIRLNNVNTADDVTLNINSIGAKPLYYNGTQMTANNCPHYNFSYLLIFYNTQSDIYVAAELTRTTNIMGSSEQYVLTQKGVRDALKISWQNNTRGIISVYQGYAETDGVSAGMIIDSETNLVTTGLNGFIRIKVKEDYKIPYAAIYNNDGTFLKREIINSGYSALWVTPTKFIRYVIQKRVGGNITPMDDYLDSIQVEQGEFGVVDGNSRMNVIVKEINLFNYTDGGDYYISSISKNYGSINLSSLIVRERQSGDIVARYYHEGFIQTFPEYIELTPVNSIITGIAVIDWDMVDDGQLVTDSNNYSLVNKAYNENAWPLLSIVNKNNKPFVSLNLVDDDGVIHTAWNYILRDIVIDNVRYLQYSNNLGKTYTQAENIYGDIVYVHFFSNGVCLFATANKCYYFSDISDIQESTLLDHNGSPYVSNCLLDFFQNDQSRNDAMIVGSKEIVVWGNYSLGSTDDPNYIARVWYSDDYGATIKCAIKFGTTIISGSATSVRHVHGALYNPQNQKFIIITGDIGTECQLIEGQYDSVNDSWSFTKLGQGDEFKFGDAFIRDNFVYFVTDYTLDSALYPRGILRVPYVMMGDYSKYQYICKISNYTGSLITTLEDDNGNKLLFPDGLGRGKLWYCKESFNFQELPISENVVITNVGSPNYNGDIYARKSLGSASFPFKLSPMVNLTKSMRQSGCKDFFVQNNVLL